MAAAPAIEILKPVVVGPNQDRAPRPIDLGTHRLIAKLTGEDTAGAYAIGVLQAKPMSGPPLHIHTREDEWFYILKGEMTFQVGDQRITAGPGTSVFAPRNVPHTWQNLTDSTVEALGMVTPADFVNFLMEASAGPVDVDTMCRLSDKYGVQLVGPPITK